MYLGIATGSMLATVAGSLFADRIYMKASNSPAQISSHTQRIAVGRTKWREGNSRNANAHPLDRRTSLPRWTLVSSFRRAET